MFTDCPSCERLFHIRAWHLQAADGWVRCGNCGETFYSLDRLHDAPVKKPETDIQFKNVVAPEAQPEVLGEEEVRVAGPRIHLPDDETTLQEDAVEDISVILQVSDDVPADFPVGIDFEDEKATGSPNRLIWAGIVFILSAAALMQLAWFNRDRLLRDYPVLMPWAQTVCERFECNLIRFRDISGIKLLNRGVKLHPRYRDALLVDATIVNHARFAQPYPEIQLAIFDTRGQLISHRDFKPGDYLKPGADVISGMLPGIPVHFVLELAGTTQDAVSFEFRFH